MPDPASPPRIALVGHCGPDAYALRSAVGRFVPGAEVVFTRDEAALQQELAKAGLLLINRTLDGDFPDGDGVGLIRRLHAQGDVKARLMLVSNYAQAQAEAEAAGALLGFGKTAMNSDEARSLVRGALGLA